MERVYYIDHISNDDINALSLKLNSMQEVSHIKINKDSISFNCARPDNIQNYLDEFCYKFNRRYFGDKLSDRLLIAALETTWYK